MKNTNLKIILIFFSILLAITNSYADQVVVVVKNGVTVVKLDNKLYRQYLGMLEAHKTFEKFFDATVPVRTPAIPGGDESTGISTIIYSILPTFPNHIVNKYSDNAGNLRKALGVSTAMLSELPGQFFRQESSLSMRARLQAAVREMTPAGAPSVESTIRTYILQYLIGNRDPVYATKVTVSPLSSRCGSCAVL